MTRASDRGGGERNERSLLPTHRSRIDHWDALEMLPPIIHAALMEANVDWSAAWTLEVFGMACQKMRRADAIEATLYVLDKGEEKDLALWTKRHGSCHLAAGATFQRYGAN